MRRGNDPAATQQPAEHALLGLLLLAGGAAHGYELAKQFRRGQPLGEIIRLAPAMLYKHLKRLARLGWVEATFIEQVPRPPRQVCLLTAAGEAELWRWLNEPVMRTREIRLEFLVKLYLAMRIDPVLAPRLAKEQLGVIEQFARSLARQLDAAAGVMGEHDAAFQQLVLQLRLEQTRAAAAWLDKLTKRIPDSV